MDAPVLYVAGHDAPRLADAQLAKLKAYAEAGGLILTSSDGTSPAFDHWVATTAAALFPRYPMAELPTTHPIYRSLFPLDKPGREPPPPLKGVGNGSRLLWAHCPADLGRTWQLRETVTHPAPFQLGLNAFIYSAGKANFHNKLRSAYLPEPTVPPVATVGLARVTYGGDWDPEPAAAGRLARWVWGHTSVKVDVADVDPVALDAARTPMALLTGTGGRVDLTSLQRRALHDYVASGGVLLIDACGGSTEAATTMSAVAEAVAGGPLAPLPTTHRILAGGPAGMSPVDAKLRPFAADLRGRRMWPVKSAVVGRGLVLFADVDVTTGLLGTNTWGVDGYDPDAATALAANALLWAVTRP